MAFRFVAALALSLAGVQAASLAAAQPPLPSDEALGRAIDDTLAAIYGPDQPGASVIVVKNGRTVLRKAYGLANVELGSAMRPDSVMAIASLSKAFTAASILLLAEQGKLSVNDEVTRFLPQFPARGARITLEHLLTHTSGISSLAETSDSRASSGQEVRLTDLLGDWVKDLPPDAQPGERWAYSNWGYNVLAAVVEQASGESYPEFVRRHVLVPLGMTHTFYDDRRHIVPMRAAGYDATADGPLNVVPGRSRVVQPNGSGSWLSTVDDLAAWSAALDGTALLPRAAIDRMFTAYHLKDGTSTRYGYGWDLGDDQGRRVQEHQGGTSGFLSHIVRMPDDGVLVVILSNRYSMSVPLQATSHRIAAMAAGRPIPEPRPVAASPSELEPLAGSYRGADVGTCTVAFEHDALTIQVPGLGTLPLIPVGYRTFRTAALTWTFAFDADEDGRGVRLRVRDWKLDDVAERVEAATPQPRPVVAVSPADLDACVGEYEALGGILVKVTRVTDHLAIQGFAQAGFEVFPVAPFEFATTAGDITYRFVRDASGAVSRYERSSGRAWAPARRLGYSYRSASTGSSAAAFRAGQ